MDNSPQCMMDFGGLDVGVNCKYTTLFEDKDDEPLNFTLIDQGLPPSRSNFVENVFSDSLDEDLFPMSVYERNFFMTMQMASSGSSVGLGQTGRPGSLTSVDSFWDDRDCHKTYTGWPTGLSSGNFADEDYGKGRERKFSTSSSTGPCIPPDLMMNSQFSSSTDQFLVDSLPDIEDVQEQIFLEDGHQNLQPDDLLIPLDEPIDSKALQEQLISQITGDDQSVLANNIPEKSTKETVFDTLPGKSEVSVTSHKSLVICTRNEKGKGWCTRCKLFNKKLKKKVCFDLGHSKPEEPLEEKDFLGSFQMLETKVCSNGDCNRRKGTPCYLTRFLQTLASFGIGKKVVIRSCRGVNSQGCKKGFSSSFTLTRLHLPSKVKKVETAPGSQNVCIDGMDVQLPAGSVILAVVNERGTLVPIPPAASQSFGENVTKAGQVSGHGSPLSASRLSNLIVPMEDLDLPSETFLDNNTQDTLGFSGISGPACGNSESIISQGNTVNFYLSSIKKEIPDMYLEEIDIGKECIERSEPTLQTASGLFSVKKETWDMEFDPVEIGEEFIDIETVAEKTPVIEAVDLDSLLAEFEATESVNINMEKNFKEDMKIERHDRISSTRESALNTPVLRERTSLDKTQGCLMEEEVRWQADSSKMLPNTSSKAKREETTKPVKKLLQRKNQMMLKKMAAHQRMKDFLPFEIIEKIRASGKRSRTKVLTEVLTPRIRRKMLVTKCKLLKKNLALKRGKTDASNVQKRKVCGNISATPFPTDHDYCISPRKKSKAKDKEDSPSKICKKLPEYCQVSVPDETTKASAEAEDSCKKDSGVESGDVSDSSIEVEERKRGCKKSQLPEGNLSATVYTGNKTTDPIEVGNVYSRLPDYVTDIGNAKSTEEVVEEKSRCDGCRASQDLPASSSGDVTKVEIKEEPKKKKKLKLDEYRMRMISSANNSRSNSPFVDEELLTKKGVKREVIGEPTEDERKASEPTNPVNQVSNTYTVEEREEGEIKEEIEDGDASNIPQQSNLPTKVKTVPTPKKHAHREAKIAVHREAMAVAYRETKATVHREAKIASRRETKVRVSPSAIPTVPKRPSKQPTVIEIDLEEEEEKEKQQQKRQTKLGLINNLPLSKMPTTSLGHSLLYSRKNGENSDQKAVKYDSSKGSSRHRACSSRSRSRSWSSKRSSRSHKSKGSSRYTSHRKSRRRWSRSRSRGTSKSRSYSPSASSSYTSIYSSRSRSRSRSRSYSKSYNSRSRSRSRSRRWDSRSRRSKRYSRSRERSRDRFRRRSWSRSPREWSSTRKRGRSPNWGYHSRSPYGSIPRYGQSHQAGRYASRHRSMEEIERDVQERRVIYVGAIEEGTTRADLRRRFDKFGPIVDINIHFREMGDNYGFVTFRYREHAYQALEHGNEDPSLPKYNLCFGGRRAFCKVQYSDLDAQNEDYGYHATPSSMDYDTLLKAALQMRR